MPEWGNEIKVSLLHAEKSSPVSYQTGHILEAGHICHPHVGQVIRVVNSVYLFRTLGVVVPWQVHPSHDHPTDGNLFN